MDKPKWLRRRRQPLWAKDEQMQSYELPTCPPRPEPAPSTPWPDDQAERWFSWPNWDVQVLHHAAPFAVTRWTNYWFTPYLGLFGDVFGGPLRNNFGPGIKDIAVRFSAKDFFLRRSRFTQLLPAFPHAFYFKHFEKGSRPAGPAVETLRIALRLDSHDLLAWVDAPDFDQKTQFIEALYRSEMGRDAEYHDIGSQLGALAESAIRWAAGEFQR